EEAEQRREPFSDRCVPSACTGQRVLQDCGAAQMPDLVGYQERIVLVLEVFVESVQGNARDRDDLIHGERDVAFACTQVRYGVEYSLALAVSSEAGGDGAAGAGRPPGGQRQRARGSAADRRAPAKRGLGGVIAVPVGACDYGWSRMVAASPPRQFAYEIRGLFELPSNCALFDHLQQRAGD